MKQFLFSDAFQTIGLGMCLAMAICFWGLVVSPLEPLLPFQNP